MYVNDHNLGRTEDHATTYVLKMEGLYDEIM